MVANNFLHSSVAVFIRIVIISYRLTDQNLRHMMKTDASQCPVQSENNAVKNSVLDQRALLENDVSFLSLSVSNTPLFPLSFIFTTCITSGLK